MQAGVALASYRKHMSRSRRLRRPGLPHKAVRLHALCTKCRNNFLVRCIRVGYETAGATAAPRRPKPSPI